MNKKDWVFSKIVDICQVGAGGTPSTSKQEYWDGEIPWMNSGDINKQIVRSVKGRITQAGLKNSSAKLVPKKSVLIALAGQGKTRGKVAVNEIELTTNQSLAFMIPKNINYKFLYIYLTTKYQDLRSISEGGGGRGGLNLHIIRNFKVYNPPIEEQERIVAVLEVWDDYLEKLKHKIQLLIFRKKYLKNELLIGSKRIAGFSSKWEEKTLGSLCKFQSGFPFKSTDFSENEGMRLIKNRDLKSDDRLVFCNPTDIPTNYIVENGDILIGMDGDFLACIWSKGKALLNQRVGRLQDFIDSDPNFLYFKIQLELDIIQNETSSTTVKHLSAKDFENRIIATPSLEEQKAISRNLLLADREITLLTEKKKLIEAQKKYLLNNLVTGKIRTPDDLKIPTKEKTNG